MRRYAFLLALAAPSMAACNAAESAGKDFGVEDGAAARSTAQDAFIDSPSASDDLGYALAGEDLYPPLFHRVMPVTCPASPYALSACRSDEDCGDGFACVCGVTGLAYANICVPAECRSDADCGGGLCLMSLGSVPDACCAFGELGLFCSRETSLCDSGGDCPGNGIACMYSSANDRFECRPFGCSCP